MSDSSYPTMKHRWLHQHLKYALVQAESGLKHNKDNHFLDVVRSIIVDAKDLYEQMLCDNSPTKEIGDDS